MSAWIFVTLSLHFRYTYTENFGHGHFLKLPLAVVLKRSFKRTFRALISSLLPPTHQKLFCLHVFPRQQFPWCILKEAFRWQHPQAMGSIPFAQAQLWLFNFHRSLRWALKGVFTCRVFISRVTPCPGTAEKTPQAYLLQWLFLCILLIKYLAAAISVINEHEQHPSLFSEQVLSALHTHIAPFPPCADTGAPGLIYFQEPPEFISSSQTGIWNSELLFYKVGWIIRHVNSLFI